MKYAVLYQSKSGNTEYLAKQIYSTLETENKTISDIDNLLAVPEADVYLVGFGVRNNFCSLDVLDTLEQIVTGKIAIFATCGYIPTESYKDSLEQHFEVWIPETAEYMGMFLCQGQMEQEVREKLLSLMPDRERELQQIFYMGEEHPDQEDIRAAKEFANRIQELVERE